MHETHICSHERMNVAMLVLCMFERMYENVAIFRNAFDNFTKALSLLPLTSFFFLHFVELIVRVYCASMLEYIGMNA